MTRARDLADLAGAADAGTVAGTNLIINGDMAVAQRGTSSASQTGGGYKAVDRFRGDQSNFTSTYSQDTDVPSGYGFSNSFKIENTTSASSDNGVLRIEHRIEAQNLRNSGWSYNNSSSYLTFSCWVKSSLAGTYYFVFKTDDGTARQYTEAFTLTAATWKKLEINISGDSGITINNDNGIGGIVTFFIDDKTANTDDATTLNGWQDYSSTSRVPDFDQKWTETDDSTFHFTGMKLEVGSTATPFMHESYAENLAKCQRYYQQYTNPLLRGACAGSTFASRMGMQLPVIMRSAPSVTITQTGSFSHFKVYDGGTTALYNSTTTTYLFKDKIEFNFDVASGLTLGRACCLYSSDTQQSSFNISAEL